MTQENPCVDHTIEPVSGGRALTADDLLHLDLSDKQAELVRGRLLVRAPPGYRHGVVASRVARLIANHAHDHDLGIVVAAETGFKLSSDPDTVRAADAAFIRRDRAPDPPPLGYPALAPDLAVEVLSPGDRAGEVLNTSVSLLTEQDALAGEDVLPGFSCLLAEVW